MIQSQTQQSLLIDRISTKVYQGKVPSILMLAVMSLIQGCTMPYLDRAKESYRVDPVLVQWNGRTIQQTKTDTKQDGNTKSPANRHYECPTPPTQATSGRSNLKERSSELPMDVLCPIDLDTYIFPQDRDSAVADPIPAYVKVLQCQEQLAPFEFAGTLQVEIANTQKQLDALGKQKTATENDFDTKSAQLAALKAAQALLAQNVKVAQTASDKAKTDSDKAQATADSTQASADKTNGDSKSTEKDKNDQNKKASDAKDAATAAKKKSDALKATAEELKKKADESNKQTDPKIKDLADQVAALANDKTNIANQIQVASAVKQGLASLNAAVGSVKTPNKPTSDITPRNREAFCITLRNQLQDELISRSTQMCQKHLSDIKATASVFNADLGFLAILQSTISSVVTGERWKSTLAAGSSITGATQTILNKEIYRDFVVPAITRAINAEREKRLALIRASRTRPLMDYSVGQAVTDASAYHEACSFSSGLELIGNDAEKRVEQSGPEIQAKIDSLFAQIKAIDGSFTAGVTTDEERTISEKTKRRIRQDIEFLQSRLTGARMGSAQ